MDTSTIIILLLLIVLIAYFIYNKSERYINGLPSFTSKFSLEKQNEFKQTKQIYQPIS